MNNIIERIKQNRLWDFPGGVFPAQFKALSNQFEIAEASLPPVFYIPVKQHIGTEGTINVSVGDYVLKGQRLTHSSNPFAVPVHAPSSGEIAEIREHVSAHPSGQPETTIVLKPDGLEKWVDLEPVQDYKSRSKADIVEQLCQAGIAGMGGAGFPTHIKLSSDKKVQYLIINGVECEPYITSDDRLMREHAWQIRQGMDVLKHLLEPEYVIVAIEDNKPEAIQAMQVACQDEETYVVCSVPTKYPAGGEKQLIELLTGEQVPKGQLPIDMGILMQNVGTCFAIADAIFSGKPLIQRVVTLTGKALNAPKNVWGLLGTPIEHLLQEAGYNSKKQKRHRVIMGGPMMGFTVASVEVPVVKISNCLLVPADKELPLPEQEMPCIRCGACADACPAGLLPQQLYWHSKAKELDKAQEFNIADCIECGACAFVCPSNIPLVHYYRQTKADIRIDEEQKSKSDKSKARFNARQERLERDKQEREEKRKQSALARERMKEDTATDAPNTVSETPASNDTSDKNNKVAAAIARAKAKKAAAQQSDSKTEDIASSESKAPESNASESGSSAPTSNKDKVAAAIARAKAKKAAAQNQASNEVQEQTQTAQAAEPETAKPETVEPEKPAQQAEPDKADKVAAAIARAKARKQQKEQAEKAAQQAEASTTKAETSAPQAVEDDAEEARRKRVEAAIAKAKARQRERNKNNTPDSGEQ